MTNGSQISEALMLAYRNTTYSALTPVGELTLRIGEKRSELDALLRSCDATSWAYISAYNPGSNIVSERQNQSAQLELHAELERESQTVFSGMALSDSGDWPAEPSLLALGLTVERAADIAVRFGQNAIVVGVIDGEAKLLMVV